MFVFNVLFYLTMFAVGTVFVLHFALQIGFRVVAKKSMNEAMVEAAAEGDEWAQELVGWGVEIGDPKMVKAVAKRAEQQAS